ncbi:hypothetical protein Mlab_1045 [Methanocorpusculum labreanum Z]|uniref:Methyltransferase type 12 n=1 Tax=Methanocorpusculum labreanum (strain ATCC 43576 / DSM 4855 / Z) TaxID=410358 RepID=A2SSA8_METLZ|nr:class I SAM-dependent methyltransferase [Methanocorpusculum labreanum]ABN07214.1 hypothetical protein Mlab_1045 [Methanocorpusculum labreanum Z]
MMELPDYCQLWDETYALALEGKLSSGDTEDSFWSNQENVDRFVKHLLNKKGGRIEDNIASMHIPPGSTVLDIGAGPGTLAVPLACAGCQVTTIEPSVPMGKAMEEYRQHMQAPHISEIRKRWENVTPQEAGLHDYVIASRSLMFGNLRENMLMMDGTAKKGVHIYWYLTSKSSSWGHEDLWQSLHGKPYYSAPNASVLWNALNQLGVYANIDLKTKTNGHLYSTVLDMQEDYYGRLEAKEPWQKDIVNADLDNKYETTDAGIRVPSTSYLAHIRWEK